MNEKMHQNFVAFLIPGKISLLQKDNKPSNKAAGNYLK